MTDVLNLKLKNVCTLIKEASPVLVAFSGGVDSTFLLKLCTNNLDSSHILAVTGISPSIPIEEQEEAQKIAEMLHVPFMTIPTHEMTKKEYRSNPINRCYYCKEELFSKLEDLKIERKFKTILDGTNADDIQDLRPGLKARDKFNVRSPLLESGFTKDDIRLLSQRWNLPTWNKPAAPCLSSRIPYGQEITLEKLDRVHLAEKCLKRLNFKEVRVRDHFPIARIEIEKKEMPRLIEEPTCAQIINELKQLGYTFITLDLAGFKSGSLNSLINIQNLPQTSVH